MKIRLRTLIDQPLSKSWSHVDFSFKLNTFYNSGVIEFIVIRKGDSLETAVSHLIISLNVIYSSSQAFGPAQQKKKSMFKLPTAKDKTKWRREMLNVITKDRVADANFKKQIEKDYACLRNILGNVICTYVSRILAKYLADLASS